MKNSKIKIWQFSDFLAFIVFLDFSFDRYEILEENRRFEEFLFI